MATSKLLVLAALAASACASRGQPLSTLAGTPLTLLSADGAMLSLAELWQGHRATVLIFWSGDCPCVRRYQQRVDALLDRYADNQVRVAAISSNAGESFAEARRVAGERGVRVPLFRDEDGSVAVAVGAHSTPTAVVLDSTGRIRFRGWIDNERIPGDPDREAWLEQAIDGVLGDRDFATRTPVYGCAISRPLWGTPAASCCHDPH